MARQQHTNAFSVDARKVVLFVLFVPSADRNGDPIEDQIEWQEKALAEFGQLFGGATAMPRARGVWRDDENGGQMIYENPILIHCYVSEAECANSSKLRTLRRFCIKMLRETSQGEVGLIVDDVYHAIRP